MHFGRRLAAVAVVVAIATTLSQAEARDRWYDNYEAALEAIEEKNLPEAERRLQAALIGKARSGYLRTYGNNYIHYAPHFQLALTRQLAGDCVSALAHLEESASQGELGLDASIDDRTTELRELCATPVVRAESKPFDVPPPPPALVLDAAKLTEALDAHLSGRFEAAAAALQEQIAAEPNSAALQLALGTTLHARWAAGGETDDGLLQRAEEALSTALRIDPSLRPDPAFTPPAVIALYRSLR